MTNNLRALTLGQILSDYRIDAILGQGGFGITYLAHDMMLDRRVAIKEYYPREFAVRDSTLTVHAAGNQDDRDTFKWGLVRFIEEARLLARLNHPNIIAVRRFFEANGTAYFVMDYCEGEPLDELIKRNGPLSLGQINKIIAPVLDGLDHLHKVNFLHRDIKPANLFIKSDGSPVLLDFGAARQEIVSHSRSVTSLATPGYAAFEQYSSKGKQGPWTDIYGFAATLYRAVTGEKPQDAPDRILEDTLVPAAVLVAKNYPPELLRAIDIGMSVRPDDRPQTIGEWRKIFSASEQLNPDLTKYPKNSDNPIMTGVVNMGAEKAVKNTAPIADLLGVSGSDKKKSYILLIASISIIVVFVASAFLFTKNKDSAEFILATKADSPKPVEVDRVKRPTPVITSVDPSKPANCINSNAVSTWNNCIGTQIFGSDTQWAGQKYVGEFKNGERSGQGTYIWPNGDKYVGNFKAGLRDGPGVLTLSDGSKYSGSFINNKRTGKGVYIWPSGDKYSGIFKDDKLEGVGTYVFGAGPNSGKKYVGEFKNGLRNGQGTLYNADGLVISSGLWLDGALMENAQSSLGLLAQCNAKVSDLNLHLPKAVDSVTTLTGSSCYNDGATVVYSLTHQITTDARFTQEQLHDALYEKIKSRVCATRELKSENKRMDIEFKYKAKNGDLMGVVRIPKNSCS